MKKVAFVFLDEGPVDQLSLNNMWDAMSLLEEGACDMVFVAINHFGLQKKIVHDFIKQKFVDVASEKARVNTWLSISDRQYPEKFIDHVRFLPADEIHLRIFADKSCHKTIYQKIDEESDRLRSEGHRVPLLFVS